MANMENLCFAHTNVYIYTKSCVESKKASAFNIITNAFVAFSINANSASLSANSASLSANSASSL